MVSKVKTDELESVQAGASIQINSPLQFSDGTILDTATPAGVDADLLDGQHGSYYYSPSNLPAAPPAGMTLKASGTTLLGYYDTVSLSGTGGYGILVAKLKNTSRWCNINSTNNSTVVHTTTSNIIVMATSTGNVSIRNYVPQYNGGLIWWFYG